MDKTDNIIALPLTHQEAWAVLEALAEVNQRCVEHREPLAVQMRSWVADRIMRLLPTPPRPEPAPKPIGKMTVGEFLDAVMPSIGEAE